MTKKKNDAGPQVFNSEEVARHFIKFLSSESGAGLLNIMLENINKQERIEFLEEQVKEIEVQRSANIVLQSELKEALSDLTTEKRDSLSLLDSAVLMIDRGALTLNCERDLMKKIDDRLAMPRE